MHKTVLTKIDQGNLKLKFSLKAMFRERFSVKRMEQMGF